MPGLSGQGPHGVCVSRAFPSQGPFLGAGYFLDYIVIFSGLDCKLYL